MPETPSPIRSASLLDRILDRKRTALVELNGSEEEPPRRRLRIGDPEEHPEEKVSIQRFTLVSRGARPGKRTAPKHGVLVAPPRAAAQLGQEIQVCRCSECDRSGVRRRMSGRRICRRDTDAHPEYALLLNMTDSLELECPERQNEGASMVSEACCREKTAYFILGPGSTTIGYVAAEVAANRRVRKAQESFALSDGNTSFLDAEDEEDKVPLVLQVYVEPEYRSKGYASEAFSLLLRDQGAVKIDGPAPVLSRIMSTLGFNQVGSKDGSQGRPVVTFVRQGIDVG